MSEKVKIMFVDDEEIILTLGRDILERFGYQVVGYSNPVEALEGFREDPDSFSLIITDQSMSEMNGVELAEKICELRENIPVILSTGHSGLADDGTSGGRGIRKIIHKPFSIKLLIAAVKELLGEDE